MRTKITGLSVSGISGGGLLPGCPSRLGHHQPQMTSASASYLASAPGLVKGNEAICLPISSLAVPVDLKQKQGGNTPVVPRSSATRRRTDNRTGQDKMAAINNERRKKKKRENHKKPNPPRGRIEPKP